MQDKSSNYYRFLYANNKACEATKNIVSDFGKAILISVAQVFAYCVDLQDYLKKFYQIIMVIGYSEIQNSYLRLDMSFCQNDL